MISCLYLLSSLSSSLPYPLYATGIGRAWESMEHVCAFARAPRLGADGVDIDDELLRPPSPLFLSLSLSLSFPRKSVCVFSLSSHLLCSLQLRNIPHRTSARTEGRGYHKQWDIACIVFFPYMPTSLRRRPLKSEHFFADIL